jgi:hypothetical protein
LSSFIFFSNSAIFAAFSASAAIVDALLPAGLFSASTDEDGLLEVCWLLTSRVADALLSAGLFTASMVCDSLRSA